MCVFYSIINIICYHTRLLIIFIFYIAYPLNLDLGNDQEYKNPIIFATGAEDSLLRLFQCRLAFSVVTGVRLS
jgi:hypothetical protein